MLIGGKVKTSEQFNSDNTVSQTVELNVIPNIGDELDIEIVSDKTNNEHRFEKYVVEARVLYNMKETKEANDTIYDFIIILSCGDYSNTYNRLYLQCKYFSWRFDLPSLQTYNLCTTISNDGSSQEFVMPFTPHTNDYVNISNGYRQVKNNVFDIPNKTIKILLDNIIPAAELFR